MKPFLTLDEQIEKLKTRDLIIGNVEAAKMILSKENYYNVINGYKKPFLKRDLDGKILQPESYVENCRFEELYSLYSFDRELRLLLLGTLLKFETHFKTSCAYNFVEEHREPYAYLNIANFSQDKDDLTKVLSNIAALSSELNRNTVSHRAKSIYISHYIEQHESVPLWVLVNSLTIGNMSYFYSAVDIKIREKIAKEFSACYKNEYGAKEKVDIGELHQILKAVNLFRNVCAHEEVLYLFKLKKMIKASVFVKYFKSEVFDHSTLGRSDIFTLVALLKLVMQKEDYIEFINRLERLFDLYKDSFSSVSFGDIIFLSGFHKDWKKDIVESL